MSQLKFVSIKTGKFYKFNDWTEISSLGGLKNVLPIDDYNNIFNEKAVNETLYQINGNRGDDFLKPYYKAEKKFSKN